MEIIKYLKIECENEEHFEDALVALGIEGYIFSGIYNIYNKNLAIFYKKESYDETPLETCQNCRFFSGNWCEKNKCTTKESDSCSEFAN